MTIKTTCKALGEASGALQALTASRLPVKAAYAVSKLAKACQSEMDEYQKARDAIFTKAECKAVDKGRKAPDGSPVREWDHADPEVVKACIKEADDLATIEVELNALPLDLEQFGNVELPGNAFYGLEWAMKPEGPAA